MIPRVSPGPELLLRNGLRASVPSLLRTGRRELPEETGPSWKETIATA